MISKAETGLLKLQEELGPPPTPEEIAYAERMIEHLRRNPPTGRVEVLAFSNVPPPGFEEP